MLRTTLCTAALVAILGCTDDDGPPTGSPDAATSADARSDAATATGDAAQATCDPADLQNVVAMQPLDVGDYCDDIQVCARDADAAAAILSGWPYFTCSGQSGGCADGQLSCVWYDPDEVDAGEYAALCDLVGSELTERARCMIYL